MMTTMMTTERGAESRAGLLNMEELNGVASSPTIAATVTAVGLGGGSGGDEVMLRLQPDADSTTLMNKSPHYCRQLLGFHRLLVLMLMP